MRAAVVRHPNAVAVRDVVAQVRLAGSDPDACLVARVDRDRADRADAHLRPDALPREAAVGRLPDAAVRRRRSSRGSDRHRFRRRPRCGRPRPRARCFATRDLAATAARRRRRDSSPSVALGSHHAQVVTIERAQQTFGVRVRSRRVGARTQSELRKLVDVPVLPVGEIPEVDDVARIEVRAAPSCAGRRGTRRRPRCDRRRAV